MTPTLVAPARSPSRTALGDTAPTVGTDTLNAIQRLDLAITPAVPWKNGGGTTQTLATWPPGADMDGFDWRVSVARIAQTGPFSAFPGVDRVIMLLGGAGVRLHGRGVDHRLDTPLQPFAFAGDQALDCELLGGPSSDLNVMTRRGRLRARLDIMDRSAHLAAAPQGLLLAVRGTWALQGGTHRLHCTPGQGAWWHRATGWQVSPMGTDARLAFVRLEEI